MELSKTHKKLNFIPLSFLVLIFCIIGVNYISDAFISTDLVKFINMDLTNAKYDVDFHVETINKETLKGEEFVTIRGWAFIKGDTENASVIYLVFDSGTLRKAALTKTYFRADIKGYFETHLQNSKRDNGFELSIPMKLLKDDKYQLGIYIEKNSAKHFSMGSTSFTKSGDEIST